MSQKELTYEDRVNILKSDREETERLHSEGKIMEAYNMLNHATKSFIKELPKMKK
ncbi:hypothetical protein [uncultured Vagococcus sp.]|uniref:hypothetical protein n=1 Tax=uncultured Vagococcus sp. TaxID=189676 RepID=UPI0028D0A380|nr:hypothetical protein [uncultured Vagococcus sp.]